MSELGLFPETWFLTAQFLERADPAAASAELARLVREGAREFVVIEVEHSGLTRTEAEARLSDLLVGIDTEPADG